MSVPRSPLRHRSIPSPHRLVRPSLAAVASLFVLSCSGPEPLPVDDLVRAGDVFLDPETLEPYSGPSAAYFDNRQVSAVETFSEGQRDGPYEWYFETGELFEVGTYRDGVLDGPYRAYWDDGGISEVGTYRDGQFDGPRAWYRNGRLIELVTYEEGELSGNFERYAEDGTLEVIGVLLRGEPCGLWFKGDKAIDYRPCGVVAE